MLASEPFVASAHSECWPPSHLLPPRILSVGLRALIVLPQRILVVSTPRLCCLLALFPLKILCFRRFLFLWRTNATSHITTLVDMSDDDKAVVLQMTDQQLKSAFATFHRQARLVYPRHEAWVHSQMASVPRMPPYVGLCASKLLCPCD